VSLPAFTALAAERRPPLDELALALAAEFREVDDAAALAELDRLGAELAGAASSLPGEQAEACRQVLGERHGFIGNREAYDHPDNSMLDLVLERRTGLPIVLSVVYVEAARRAGIQLAGVGLPGHFVVGHFGANPPVLLDPFSRGRVVTEEARPAHIRVWRPHEIALRMLNNLVGSYTVRGDLTRAIRAAELRLALPVDEEANAALTVELKALRARLN
jgi:regulator of sirC expression with transglutaminase-like and TPR domain